MMTATQPGQAATDVGCVALLLVAVALLLESELHAAPLAVAGLALGMAVATKLSVAAPALVIVVGVLELSRRADRPRAAATWLIAFVASASFWFVRDWIVAGSPIPWYDVHLGPLHLSVDAAARASTAGQPALARESRTATDGVSSSCPVCGSPSVERGRRSSRSSCCRSS